jgi:hypothetical protein
MGTYTVSLQLQSDNFHNYYLRKGEEGKSDSWLGEPSDCAPNRLSKSNDPCYDSIWTLLANPSFAVAHLSTGGFYFNTGKGTVNTIDCNTTDKTTCQNTISALSILRKDDDTERIINGDIVYITTPTIVLCVNTAGLYWGTYTRSVNPETAYFKIQFLDSTSYKSCPDCPVCDSCCPICADPIKCPICEDPIKCADPIKCPDPTVCPVQKCTDKVCPVQKCTDNKKILIIAGAIIGALLLLIIMLLLKPKSKSSRLSGGK